MHSYDKTCELLAKHIAPDALERIRLNATLTIQGIHHTFPKDSAYTTIQKLIAAAQSFTKQYDEKTACQAGCHKCCERLIFVNRIEGTSIAAKLASTHTVPEIKELSARLHAIAADIRAHETRPAQRCFFLQDGLCSIYEFRPFLCVMTHSLDVTACQNHSPFTFSKIPRIIEHSAYTGLLYAAFAEAMSPEVETELHGTVATCLDYLLEKHFPEEGHD